MIGIDAQPLATLKWVHRDEFEANDYNPNHVARPELELLIESITQQGWTQPLVVRASDERTIIDGFHRWSVSADPRVYALTEGLVPRVLVAGDEAQIIMATVRHNRARGEHGVDPMGQIVRLVRDHGLSIEEVRRGMGMEQEEIDRLAELRGSPERVGGADATLGNAWVPGARARRKKK